mmetsp:Transcript_52120/g.124143  ORF Transcript_52120/g.124143 Transcript_52120/m.124143 type:complete len:222 (+) Transcript_52120:400-1065(+)
MRTGAEGDLSNSLGLPDASSPCAGTKCGRVGDDCATPTSVGARGTSGGAGIGADMPISSITPPDAAAAGEEEVAFTSATRTLFAHRSSSTSCSDKRKADRRRDISCAFATPSSITAASTNFDSHLAASASLYAIAMRSFLVRGRGTLVRSALTKNGGGLSSKGPSLSLSAPSSASILCSRSILINFLRTSSSASSCSFSAFIRLATASSRSARICAASAFD